MTIFPIPKKLEVMEGTCPVDAPITYVQDGALGKEEYRILIAADGIQIVSSCDEGAFRAKSTLKQIVRQNPKALPCLTLHDWPDFPNRGVFYHTGLRMPTMSTIKKQIDILADMKLNHMQMLICPSNYNYPSYPSMHTGENPFTADELKEISQYARERYINVVPTIATFGHMDDWLENPEFADLAECPDGFDFGGAHSKPMTLDPTDPRSQQLVRGMIDDLIPASGCTMLNIGGDETIELGMGKSKELCEKVGRTQVFLDFLSQTIEYLQEKGVKPTFWADILLTGKQEVLDTIPKDSVVLNWGYERMLVSEESCIRLEKTGVPYWNCPGTSGWHSLVGESYKAMQNIARCAVLGKRHGASGLLITDWGDRNLNHFALSYFAITYGAAMGWSVGESDWEPVSPRDYEDDNHAIREPDSTQIVKTSPTVEACFEYLNQFVYQDARGRMAQIVYDAGQYGHITKNTVVGNSTSVNRMLVNEVLVNDGIIPEYELTAVYGYDVKDLRATIDFLNVILFRLAHEPRMTCEDAQIILDEYKDSIAMLLYGCNMGMYHIGELQGYTEEGYADMMRTLGSDIVREHDRVWLCRNRPMDNKARQFFRQFDHK